MLETWAAKSTSESKATVWVILPKIWNDLAVMPMMLLKDIVVWVANLVLRSELRSPTLSSAGAAGEDED